jgi:hypothetical protein
MKTHVRAPPGTVRPAREPSACRLGTGGPCPRHREARASGATPRSPRKSAGTLGGVRRSVRMLRTRWHPPVAGSATSLRDRPATVSPVGVVRRQPSVNPAQARSTDTMRRRYRSLIQVERQIALRRSTATEVGHNPQGRGRLDSRRRDGPLVAKLAPALAYIPGALLSRRRPASIADSGPRRHRRPRWPRPLRLRRVGPSLASARAHAALRLESYCCVLDLIVVSDERILVLKRQPFDVFTSVSS